MSLLTCRDFLKELSDFLDGAVDPALRQELERHINECPNCWVVLDTTKRTVQIFKDLEEQEIPPTVHQRLMEALENKMKSRRNGA